MTSIEDMEELALLLITPGMSPRQARRTNPTFPSMLASKTGGKWGLSLPMDTASEVPTMTSTVYLAFKTPSPTLSNIGTDLHPSLCQHVILFAKLWMDVTGGNSLGLEVKFNLT